MLGICGTAIARIVALLLQITGTGLGKEVDGLKSHAHPIMQF